jgi:hypothetical protein
VEIAPAEPASPEPVSIAEAVAQEPLARSPWRIEGSFDRDQDDDGFLPAGEPAAGDPIKVSGVDVNLDHVRFETKHTPADHGAADGPLDSPAILSPQGAAASDNPPGLAAVSGANGAPTDPGTPPPVGGGLSELGSAGPKTAIEGLSESKSPGPAAGPIPPPSEIASGAGTAAAEEPAPPAAEIDLEAGEEHPDDVPADDPVVSPEVVATPEPAPAGETEPETRMAAAEDVPAASEDSGGDVLYPPNDSFAMGADVAYASPAGSSLSVALVDAVLSDPGSDDVVDLEALCRLAEAPPPVFDLVDRARAAGRPAEDVTVELSPAADPGAGGPLGPEAGEVSGVPERVPASHDLDL